jgi:RNA polymerase-binding transcription factor DksA
MTLNRRQVIELARAMAERRGALLEEIRKDVARARDEQYATVAGTAPDIGDEAVADLIADVDQAEVTRDLGELRALDAALSRVADGTYGVCSDCGEDIAPERLQAQPAAARCAPCQQRHEKTYSR